MYKPINMKRSSKFGNNYWEVYSPKLNRNVRLFSDLEYENWILIETNPKIISFCEQPLEIKETIHGKLKKSIFDMWVLYDDKTEQFQEVKYQSQLIDINSRASRQVQFQKQWCSKNGYDYVVRTDTEIRKNKVYLDTLKQVIGQVRNASSISDKDLEEVLKIIRYNKISLKDLIQITNFSYTYIVNIICILVYNGLCEILNKDIGICLKTEVIHNVKI